MMDVEGQRIDDYCDSQRLAIPASSSFLPRSVAQFISPINTRLSIAV